MRILIAEDDPITRRMLQKALENWGHYVIPTCDGSEAWSLYQEGAARFLITDWMMPGVDGPELCRRIRAANTGSSEPVYIILLTSRGSVQDLAAGFQAGADDFIAKPFNPDELRARVQAGERIIALQSQLWAAREEMARLALTDPLTGILNRRALMDTLRRDEDRMRRENRAISVVMVDVDRFKEINDRYGHQTGDRVLQTVANCLMASVRGGDEVGRWGGEEFLLVLPGADIIQAAEVAERCRALLESHQVRNEESQLLSVRASFGVSSTEGADRTDIMSLVQQADKAMYWAKESGRNRVKIFVGTAQQDEIPRDSRHSG